jgi:hypothetical protein
MGYQSPTFKSSSAVEDLLQIYKDDPRIVECAMAHAIEGAIRDRYSGLSHFFEPDALAQHLAADGVAAIQGRSLDEICSPDSGRWRAGRQRFADVEARLAGLVDGAQQHSHADVVRLAGGRGLLFRKARVEDQLEYLRSLPWRRFSARAQADLVLGRAAKRLVDVANDVTGDLGDGGAAIDGAFELLVWKDPARGTEVKEAVRKYLGQEPKAAAQGAHDGR